MILRRSCLLHRAKNNRRLRGPQIAALFALVGPICSTRIMIVMRWFAFVVLASASCFGFTQSDLFGPGQFTQTREMSGLPGGSFGVLPDGTPSFKGAMALSTPIAYSLNNWHYAFGLKSVSPDMRLRGLD